MNDYIGREAAILAAMEYDGDGNGQDASMDIAGAIGDIPAADVVERKVGRWEKRLNIDVLTWCSECGWMKHQGDDRRYNFCPNCGALMVNENE